MSDFEAKFISEVIGEIYESAIDAKRWPRVLETICARVDGLCAEIQTYNPMTGANRWVAHHGWEEDVVARCNEHGHLNPGAPIALVTPLGEPLWAERDYGYEAFSKSLYFRLCLAGVGHRDYIHVPLVRNVTQMTGWGVTRHERRGAFSENEVDLARLLTPHIRRALVISDLLDERQAAETTLQATLDALACAALVVESDRRILLRNAAAGAELEKSTLLLERHGRVASPDANVSRLIASMAEAGPTRGRDVEVDDPACGLRQVTWVRLSSKDGADGPFLLLARTPAAELKTPLGTASLLFGLTYAETQVLATLLQGRNLDEASELLGVSRSTVKTHLDSIFAKSGERRQPDLVRRVVGLMTPVG